MKKEYPVLASYVRDQKHWEAEKAEVMFKRFASGNFSYDDISNHPDYPAYASAELLHEILPQMIDEMFKRNDIGNFLIYHIISAIDPWQDTEFPETNKRAEKVIELADKNFAEKACQFLVAMEPDPPNGKEQIQRLLPFWKKKLKELQDSKNTTPDT